MTQLRRASHCSHCKSAGHNRTTCPDLPKKPPRPKRPSKSWHATEWLRDHGGTLLDGLAVRIARLVEVSIDELLDGRALPAQLCPHCGRPTDDFSDEQTVVEDRPRQISRKVGDRNEF